MQQANRSFHYSHILDVSPDALNRVLSHVLLPCAQLDGWIMNYTVYVLHTGR